MRSIYKKTQGFTIVELLIVIVVIGILAAITIVAYTGVQQRANNSSTISAISQTLKLISAYISTNGTYPGTAAGGCIITPPNSSSCSSGSPNNNGIYTGVINNLATIGTVPKSVPLFDSNYNGALYLYDTSRTMNGQAAPAILLYYLQGQNINCGGLGSLTTSSGYTMVTATQPYTASTSSVTTCVISIPGPAS